MPDASRDSQTPSGNVSGARDQRDEREADYLGWQNEYICSCLNVCVPSPLLVYQNLQPDMIKYKEMGK